MRTPELSEINTMAMAMERVREAGGMDNIPQAEIVPEPAANAETDNQKIEALAEKIVTASNNLGDLRSRLTAEEIQRQKDLYNRFTETVGGRQYTEALESGIAFNKSTVESQDIINTLTDIHQELAKLIDEAVQRPDAEVIDFTNLVDRERYYAELLQQKNALKDSRKLFRTGALTPVSRDGIIAVGTFNLRFYHWEQAFKRFNKLLELQSLEQQPDVDVAIKKQLAILNKQYVSAQDLLELINRYAILKEKELELEAPVKVVANDQVDNEIPAESVSVPAIFETKEAGGSDVETMLAEVSTYQQDLPRLESQRTAAPFERTTLRALIENFHALHTRYTRAEAGEEKNILLRQMVKMHANVKQAHNDAEKFIVAADQSLLEKTVADDVRNIQPPIILPEPTGEEHKPIIPRVEGVAARELVPTLSLSPEVREAWREKMVLLWGRLKPPAKAWLLAAVAAVVPQTEGAKHVYVGADTVPFTSTTGIGPDASWTTTGNNLETARQQDDVNKPVAVVEGTGEVISIPVRPYTSEVATQGAVTGTADTLPKVSEVSVLEPVTASPELTPVPQGPVESVIGTQTAPVPATENSTLLPNNPSAQNVLESVTPTEVLSGADVMIEVVAGNSMTLPDRALDRVFDAVDTKGLPEVLVTKLKAQEKTAFFADRERLIAAGILSGNEHVTFPGDKINYSDPKAALERAINENLQYLSVPHTEVAAEGDTLTNLTLKSFANDLRVIPEAARRSVGERALASYLATPGALEALKLTHKDEIQPGDVVPLKGVVPFMAAAAADYARETALDTTGGAKEVVPDTMRVSDSTGEVPVGAVTMPENYPGGLLEYSKAYNEKLESLGIAPTAPSMIDNWFTQQTPDNRALLEMSVGELTKIMMQEPLEVARELALRKVSLESANKLYELVIQARADGQAPYTTDATLTGKEVISARVLKEAAKTSN